MAVINMFRPKNERKILNQQQQQQPHESIHDQRDFQQFSNSKCSTSSMKTSPLSRYKLILLILSIIFHCYLSSSSSSSLITINNWKKQKKICLQIHITKWQSYWWSLMMMIIDDHWSSSSTININPCHWKKSDYVYR